MHTHTRDQTQRGRWAAFDGLVRAQELDSGGRGPRGQLSAVGRAPVARSKGCLGPTVTQTMRRMARRRRRVSPDDEEPRSSWWRTNKLIGGAPGAADDQTVNTETTGTRRQAAQQEEDDDDDDGIDWSKMPPEEVFKRFDTDGSGEIDLEEFKVMLKKLKIQMSSAKAVKYFKMCDVRSGNEHQRLQIEERRKNVTLGLECILCGSCHLVQA